MTTSSDDLMRSSRYGCVWKKSNAERRADGRAGAGPSSAEEPADDDDQNERQRDVGVVDHIA